MSNITIIAHNQIFEHCFDEKFLLSDAIRQYAGYFAMPCGGAGKCGKCKVRAEGALAPLSDHEKAHLTADEIARGFRLACCTYAVGDCRVTVDSDHSKAEIVDDGSFGEYIHSAAQARTGCGIAADIGTTTVTVHLYRLESGERLAVVSEMNRQAGFGADVVSRIQFSAEHSREPLRRAISSQLSSMIAQAVQMAGVGLDQLTHGVVTGNTTMLHFLTGLPAEGIMAAPFTPSSLFGYAAAAASLFEELGTDFEVYLPPCISAYVGADITCAILASGMCERDETSLLVDIGTNGEMAVFHGGKLLTCSTAAGPAFEGADIECGMMAQSGAVCSVFVANGQIGYRVLGDAKPKGICGSGLLDAAAVMLQTGVLDSSGVINQDGHDFTHLITEWNDAPAFQIGDSGVFMTARDIRKLQLAKSAICAGIQTLIGACGISGGDLERFFIAGGFGSKLNKYSAAQIGLIPPLLAEKAESIGNAAISGAVILLLSPDATLKTEAIAQKGQELILSGNAEFMDLYIENMLFYEDGNS